jgi:hypothetical protein
VEFKAENVIQNRKLSKTLNIPKLLSVPTMDTLCNSELNGEVALLTLGQSVSGRLTQAKMFHTGFNFYVYISRLPTNVATQIIIMVTNYKNVGDCVIAGDYQFRVQKSGSASVLTVRENGNYVPLQFSPEDFQS